MTSPVNGVPDKPFLIVTGSSAGGINALVALLSNLSANFPAAIVVAQHIDPAHQSRLGEILEQRSHLTVVRVEKSEALCPGTVYVIPPNHDVDIVDSHADIHIQARPGPKPSIDRLFASAARVYGDRAIGIVLSGLGSDGLAGARSIKEEGGLIIVQDPQTANFPSMPLAIPPTLSDFVLRPEAMGELLMAYMERDALLGTETDQHLLRTLLIQLRESSGIDFLQYKEPTIRRRLARLMAASHVSTIPEYLQYLQRNPGSYERLISAFLIKVTEFFRDAQLFDHLRTDLLPKLIAHAAETTGELRIWTAGVSTGEEAYSTAIVCAEVLQQTGSHINVRIFATDIDEEAIEFARRGLYARESIKSVPEALVERYFTRHGDSFEIAKKSAT